VRRQKEFTFLHVGGIVLAKAEARPADPIKWAQRISSSDSRNGVFIADVIGYYDVYKGSNYYALQQAAQIPDNDPLQLAAPIALATEHLGIGITASTSCEHPYTFARRIATADHHTKGRVGWNIVTSYLESGAKNISQGGLRRHDDRYEVASEYVGVLYQKIGACLIVKEQKALEQRFEPHGERVGAGEPLTPDRV
jgi:alkanesulfonate monooxygenase SsuD/methylene tetrahydromethanopterin reductase-like flavin-dependent oxidoreductase (luciferase family)